jgi:hypothetical protein
MLFSYQTGYIMWHSRHRIYIPWGAAMEHRSLLNRFSLLHIFSLVLQPWMSANIRKTDGVYISVPKKRLKHGRQNITLHWINGVVPWCRKFSRLNVLFICYGTAVEHRSLLHRSGMCDGINRCNIFLFTLCMKYDVTHILTSLKNDVKGTDI